MKHSPILVIFGLLACGSTNEVEVSGGSNNTIVIEYTAPICEDPVFETKEDKLNCIDALTTLQIDGELRVEDVESLTPEQQELFKNIGEPDEVVL